MTAKAQITLQWDESEVEITETGYLTRLNEEPPNGLLTIALVRACDAAGISIDDVGKSLIEEGIRRRSVGA